MMPNRELADLHLLQLLDLLYQVKHLDLDLLLHRVG